MATTNWNRELEAARLGEDDTSILIGKAPADESVWERPFDNGYGTHSGEPVLAWTENRVYFPAVYDGAEWLDSAPRYPQDHGQAHIGGE